MNTPKYTPGYTPGPWRISDPTASDGRRIEAGKSDYIGHTCGYSPRPGSKQRQLSEAEATANAVLISAAPELFEACRMAMELIRMVRNSRHFPKSMHNSDKFQLENACAAIGKAIHKATLPHNPNT